MKNLQKRTRERGFILLAVYMAAIFMCLLSAVLFARHQLAIQATERYQNRVLAFNAAEAGIDYALHELATNQNSRQTDTATTPYTSFVISMPATNPTHAFRYTITKTDNGLIRKIDATGCAPTCTATSRADQTSNITVYAQIYKAAVQGGLFDYGVYTKQTMNLSGFRFDSYNSSLPYGNANISSAGAVAADSTATGAITMSGTTVNGSALVSQNGNPSIGISATTSTITGARDKIPAGWTLGAPTPIASLTTPPTEINLSNITKSKTLAAGTYHSSSISISGQATLSSSGAVKIYVDGNVDITGQGTTAADNKPGNLQIYVTGTDVKIRGNGSFTGGLYAPNAAVSFQTSNSGKGGVIYGAVVAKTFSTFGGGNPTVHFDLAMKTAPAPDPNHIDTVNVVTWQEMNSLAWGTGQTVP